MSLPVGVVEGGGEGGGGDGGGGEGGSASHQFYLLPPHLTELCSGVKSEAAARERERGAMSKQKREGEREGSLTNLQATSSACDLAAQEKNLSAPSGSGEDLAESMYTIT